MLIENVPCVAPCGNNDNNNMMPGKELFSGTFHTIGFMKSLLTSLLFSLLGYLGFKEFV